MTQPLPTNTPCVLTGEVVRCTPTEKDGKTSHTLLIRYNVERNTRDGVDLEEATREFWAGDYYKRDCFGLKAGDIVTVEFNAKSREYNGKTYPKDDVRRIRCKTVKADRGSASSERLNYSNNEETPF